MRRPLCAVIRRLLIPLVLLGCGGPDAAAPLVQDASRLYIKLRLNHKAIMLSTHAPYDTVQLRAVPVSLTGDTLAYDGTIEFFRLNILDTSVRVDSTTGMVVARSGTNGTRVIARLTIDAVTWTDTALIMVRTEPQVRRIARMEFFPNAPDSNWRWAGERTDVNVQPWIRFFDTMNAPILASQVISRMDVERPEVFWSSANNESEYVNVVALRGETWLRASVYAYGTQFSDSMIFRRIDPPIRLVLVDRFVPVTGDPTITFLPGTIEARAGTTVIFLNKFGTEDQDFVGDFGVCVGFFCGNRIRRTMDYPSEVLVWVDSVDIQFENPAAADSGAKYGTFLYDGVFSAVSDGSTGDIPPFALMYCTGFGIQACGGRGGGVIDRGYRTRRFTTPGTYHYTSTRFPGARGTIIITE